MLLTMPRQETATTDVPVFSLRTAAEIVARIDEVKAGDFFGFQHEVLVSALPFISAKPFLDRDATAKDWTVALTRDVVLAEMIDYLDFAWDKALGHRGISAGRSIQKIGEWLWILGDTEAVDFVTDETNYANYGAPALLYVSKRYGTPWPGTSEAVNMAAGRCCEPGCEMGCGR